MRRCEAFPSLGIAVPLVVALRIGKVDIGGSLMVPTGIAMEGFGGGKVADDIGVIDRVGLVFSG